MDEPVIKLDYRTAVKRPKRRRSIWTFLALLFIPCIIVNVAVMVPVGMVAMLSDAPPGANPLAKLLTTLATAFYALTGGWLICAIMGLVKTLRQREKYSLVFAIVGIASLPAMVLLLCVLVRVRW